jgi:predicted hotdog family 3-hydroxylacyl-ACP dehydratase
VTPSAWPALGELLPHAGPMRLLARVVAHSREATSCELEVAASALFAGESGAVPAWVALEWMAQCAAAHGGLAARATGAPAAQGMLVGARRLTLARGSLALGEKLCVSARATGSAGALVSFECEVNDASGALVATGSISVVVGSFSGKGG